VRDRRRDRQERSLASTLHEQQRVSRENQREPAAANSKKIAAGGVGIWRCRPRLPIAFIRITVEMSDWSQSRGIIFPAAVPMGCSIFSRIVGDSRNSISR